MLLSNEKIAHELPYRGCLTIEETHEDGPAKQYSRKARLLDTALSESARDVIPPLFAIQLFPLGRGCMVIYGYQIVVNSNTGAVQQHEQSWLILSTYRDEVSSAFL